MKFEDFLMQRSEDQQKRLDLKEEVVKLQEELDDEVKVNRFLRCALFGPGVMISSLSSPLLPLQVQMLLAELAVVEEEIICLEKKIQKLKICLYLEKKQTKEWEMHQLQKHQQQHQNHIFCTRRNRRDYTNFRDQRLETEGETSIESTSEIPTMSSTISKDDAERSRKCKERRQNKSLIPEVNSNEMPNKLSEELVKCLIGIFLKLNKAQANLNCEGSAIVPKLTLSCMNSKGFISKTFTDNSDPYGIQSDLDGTVRDVGPYKNFIQFTRSSLEMSHVSECFPAIRKSRNMMLKLSHVDLSFLTYKQKLAFWINIYNAGIMHAFLQNGLPSTSDELLGLMNKAMLNVGGVVLNALAIEHFILRHPCNSRNNIELDFMDEKEMLLRHAYGLGYPEPNITFALCRGSWSSPALRVYTAENVVNELERAKVEYLEASVGITNKKKILVPKLLQWHMQDFADDMESLLEWIYSQLPRSGSLKRLILDCLNGDMKISIIKMVDIQPYESEFRYLLPS